MPNFFKLLPLILKLNDVTACLRPDKQGPDVKPFFYTQRFWGAVVALLFGVAGYYAVDLSTLHMTPEQLSTNLVSLSETIGTLFGSAYGLIMLVKGVVDANKRKAESAKPDPPVTS